MTPYLNNLPEQRFAEAKNSKNETKIKCYKNIYVITI